MQTQDRGFLEQARQELNKALLVDSSSAQMLQKLIVVDALLGTDETLRESSVMFERFKALNPQNPFVGAVEQQRSALMVWGRLPRFTCDLTTCRRL